MYQGMYQCNTLFDFQYTGFYILAEHLHFRLLLSGGIPTVNSQHVLCDHEQQIYYDHLHQMDSEDLLEKLHNNYHSGMPLKYCHYNNVEYAK